MERDITSQGTSSIVTTLTVDRSSAFSSVIVLDNIKENLSFQKKQLYKFKPQNEIVIRAINKDERRNSILCSCSFLS
jgi:hypothetical protein